MYADVYRGLVWAQSQFLGMAVAFVVFGPLRAAVWSYSVRSIRP